MQKLSLSQSLQQKLSPQQIQFIKLLQIPTAELETRIEEELEINPALEEGMDEEYDTKDEFD
ncbi:MAG: RNA polymerase sigma-54 factor, partial [Cytophagaceae bacterium]